MTLKSLADYGKPFQQKVLGALLSDKRFVQTVRDVLKETYFDAESFKWIVSKILQYWDQYHTSITMEVLKVELQKVDNDVLKVAIKEELRHSYESTQEDLEYVKSEFTAFCRNQEMKRAILESADLLKAENYEGIRVLVENALKAGQEKSLGHEYKKDVETRYREDYRPTIPTPWSQLNDLLAGGLGPGDLFLIFGGPGIGKSWLSIACAAHAVELGYNVIYYTLELGEDYVARRFDSYFTGYTGDELRERREEVDKLMEDLPGNLIVKEYAPKTATISMLEAHIEQCKDEGVKPDMIIIDYIDYLALPKNIRYADKKDVVDDLYVGAKKLAKTLQIPVISPSQVNRSGARDQIVEADKAAGSYDKNMVTDASISLSRQKEDKVLGTGRIHVMKNRFGADGITFNVRMNTNNGRVEFEGEADMDAARTGQPVYSLDKKLVEDFFKK